MPFMKCPHCGKQYSDKYDDCPFCHPGGISKRDRISKAILVILITVSCVSFGTYHANQYFEGERAKERAETARIETVKKQNLIQKEKDVEKSRLKKIRADRRRAERLVKEKEAAMKVAAIKKHAFSDSWKEAQQAVMQLPCKTGGTVDQYLDNKAAIPAIEDLGWHVYPTEYGYEVERLLLLNQRMQLKYRWKYLESGEITPLNGKAIGIQGWTR
ncbi:MAG: hypothetical protein KAT62_00565 [Desulfuromonadales bacterium]|nr:hypothetical protein [Desulfuromonadales bacterium]